MTTLSSSPAVFQRHAVDTVSQSTLATNQWSATLVTALALTGSFFMPAPTMSTPPSQVRYLGVGNGNIRIYAHPETQMTALHSSTSRSPSPTERNQENPGQEAHSQSDSDIVRSIKDTTGLTWEQIGRIFGVSRRAVHNWANGGRINASNSEALYQMASAVRELEHLPLNERRRKILAIGPNSHQLVDRLRAAHRSAPDDIAGEPFHPENMLENLHGDVAT